MTSAVEISGLSKSFGHTRALDDLNMTVARGEVHGFLGPNGAGKTTTLRILMGLLRSGAGAVRVLGKDPWRQAVPLHRDLAGVPGDVALWPNLSGGETIDLLARLRGGIRPGRRAELIERFALDTTKKARNYSRGNRQKVALITALASDAELLLLDEPTAGLDPLMEAVFQECIREVRAEGRTVLLSSHILAQVEVLADRVSIVRQGTIVETGTLSELRHLTRTTVTARTRDDPALLGEMDGVHACEVRGQEVTLEVDADELGALVSQLARLGVETLTARPPTLEQLLLRHYGDSASGRGAGDGSPANDAPR